LRDAEIDYHGVTPGSRAFLVRLIRRSKEDCFYLVVTIVVGVVHKKEIVLEVEFDFHDLAYSQIWLLKVIKLVHYLSSLVLVVKEVSDLGYITVLIRLCKKLV